jgi:hypothetical protein
MSKYLTLKEFVEFLKRNPDTRTFQTPEKIEYWIAVFPSENGEFDLSQVKKSKQVKTYNDNIQMLFASDKTNFNVINFGEGDNKDKHEASKLLAELEPLVAQFGNAAVCATNVLITSLHVSLTMMVEKNMYLANSAFKQVVLQNQLSTTQTPQCTTSSCCPGNQGKIENNNNNNTETTATTAPPCAEALQEFQKSMIELQLKFFEKLTTKQ